MRSILARVCALVVCLGFVTAIFAADGTVVSYEKGTLVVKVGDKEQKIETKGVAIKGDDGKDLKGKAAAEVLKAGTKVEVTEKDGKVTEVKVKK